jgi:small subunit ribosomal protein S7
MPRRREVPKREVVPDPKYGDVSVARFISRLMMSGKKSLAEQILYGAFDLVEAKTKEDALQLFKKAVDGVKPMVEVKSRRVGGATYQVPVEVRPSRRSALGMKWLITYARDRSEPTMKERLASEILDAANGRGGAFKKKEDTHRMAEANKAFAHYRW